jgi:hypothetical protein
MMPVERDFCLSGSILLLPAASAWAQLTTAQIFGTEIWR